MRESIISPERIQLIARAMCERFGYDPDAMVVRGEPMRGFDHSAGSFFYVPYEQQQIRLWTLFRDTAEVALQSTLEAAE